jgi:hypothetical protein
VGLGDNIRKLISLVSTWRQAYLTYHNPHRG